MQVACPHCSQVLVNDGTQAGVTVSCPTCRGPFQMPPLIAAAVPTARPAGSKQVPAGVSVPVLISAIGNIVVGVLVISTCFLAPLAIPMGILCIFEFMLYMRFGSEPASRTVRSASTLAIFEIVVGLFNWCTLICGIIVLVNSNKFLREQSAGHQRPLPNRIHPPGPPIVEPPPIQR